LALYDLYEKDGAVFRKPAARKHGFVDEAIARRMAAE
jgi:hypothetical protein